MRRFTEKKRNWSFCQFTLSLFEEYNIKLRQDNENSFLGKWYSNHIRNKIQFVFEEIKKIQNRDTKEL